MEYCCHVWAGAPSSYMEWLDRLQKWICRTVDPSLIFSIGITLVDVHLNWLNWFHFLILEGGLLVERLCDFSVTIPRCHKDANGFFPRTARLWNSLPIECFPLTYGLNEFKFRINRQLLTIVSL